ncbi:hypothetical protein Tco_0161589 [Tanacetum coccineum]
MAALPPPPHPPNPPQPPTRHPHLHPYATTIQPLPFTAATTSPPQQPPPPLSHVINHLHYATFTTTAATIATYTPSPPSPATTTRDYLTKFDPKSTEGIFLGYSPNSKEYVILNKETMRVEESLNVRFDESPPPKSSPIVDDDIIDIQIIENQIEDIEIKKNEPLNKEIVNIKETKEPSPLRFTVIDLLMTMSELKNKLKTIEKGKNVNTKFDKSETLGKPLCVTPLNTNTAVKAKKVSNTKVNADRSKPVTSHSTPKK